MQVKNRIFTIYRLIFPNQKSYIGITSRPLKRRLEEHKSHSKTGKLKIHAAIRKYGFENIKYEVLLETQLKDECYSLEVEFINQYNTRKAGYNSSTGGEQGAYGCVRSAEIRKKISETKRKTPFMWKDHPELLNRKVEAQIGRKQPESQKRKVRDANSHNHLVFYSDGTIVPIKGLKEYSIHSGIPFDTLRYTLYNNKPIPKWNIEKVIKA